MTDETKAQIDELVAGGFLSEEIARRVKLGPGEHLDEMAARGLLGRWLAYAPGRTWDHSMPHGTIDTTHIVTLIGGMGSSLSRGSGPTLAGAITSALSEAGKGERASFVVPARRDRR